MGASDETLDLKPVGAAPASAGTDSRAVGESVQTRLLRGAASGAVYRLATALLNIVTVAVLTRLMTPEHFGAYAMAVSITTFGSIVAMLGLENTVVREVARAIAMGASSVARATIQAARLMTVAGAAVTAAVLVVFRGPLLDSALNAPLLVGVTLSLSLWILFQGLNQLQAAALRGGHQLVEASRQDGFIRVACLLGALLLVGDWASDARHVIRLSAAAAAASMLWGSVVISRWWRRSFRDPDRSNAPSVAQGHLLNHSWPLMLTTVLGFLGTQADLWLVGAFSTGEQVAVYGAILRLLFLVSLPLMIQSATLGSTTAELWALGERARLERVLRTTATMASIPTIVLFLVFLFFGRAVLAALFGAHYATGALVLVILSAGRVASVMTGPCGHVLMMTGHQRLQLAVNVITLTLMLGSAFWAGQRFGMVGVASAFAISTLVNNLVMLLSAYRVLGIWTHASFDLRVVGRVIKRLAV